MGASSICPNQGNQLQFSGEHREGVPGGPHHVEDGHDVQVQKMYFFS